MLAIGAQARFVIAGLQMVATLAAMSLGGVSAAVAQERAEVEHARGDLDLANRTFHKRVQQALDDGTAGGSLEPLAAAEFQAWHAEYRRNFFVDRLLLDDLRSRGRRIQALTGSVAETEHAAELDLAAQLGGAIDRLQQDLAAAHSAHLQEAADYDNRASAFTAWRGAPAIPREGRWRLDQVGALDSAVTLATSAKISADQAAAAAAEAAAAAADAAVAAAAAALQASRDNAAYQHDRAHRDLAQVLGIGVLHVSDIAAAIAAIDARQSAAQAVPDLDALAADYANQARQLENILGVRSTTYNQLARSRSLAARTAGLGVDVGAFIARLDAANAALDAAPDIASILAVADTIRDINNSLNAAYSNALAHPPPPPGSVILNVPYFAQVYSLSCEEAALQMALAYEGIGRNQDEILGAIGVDRRAPEVDRNGNVVHWGNPYTSFVGDPNGYREGAQYGSRSGYGTYYPTISRAASAFGGRVLQANEGIAPQALYDAIAAHHPSVVWVAWEYSPHAVTSYVAFDGATVMYGAPWEHAVTLVGTSPGSVLINNPHGGQQWISKGTFESAYAMFNRMAVILG